MRLDQIRAALDENEDFDRLVDRLRELTGYRDRTHLVAQVLAPLIGITRNAAYKWLQGRRTPSSRSILALQMIELLLRVGDDMPVEDTRLPARLPNRVPGDPLR